MQNNPDDFITDQKFSELYDHVKKNVNTDSALHNVNLSILQLYLIVKGREHVDGYSAAFIKKIMVRLYEAYLTFYEWLIGAVLLFRFFIYNKLAGKNKAIVIIVEPTHLQQMMGMKTHLDKYNPVYITDKRRYVNILKRSLKTSHVLLVPNVYFRPRKIDTVFIGTLLKKFNLDVSGLKLNKLTEILHLNTVRNATVKRLAAFITRHADIRFGLTYNDLSFTGRAITSLLNEQKTRTFYCMHGLLSDELIETFHVCSDYMIFGDYTRPILIKKGIDDSHIYTIGSPYLEYAFMRTSPPFFAALKEKHRDKKIALILLSGRGHTTSKEHHEAIITALEEVISRTSQAYHFIFKLHRKDKPVFYKSIIENPDTLEHTSIYTFNHLNGKDNIFDWIKLSDVIITGASTSAMEAMYMNKPVLTIDMNGEYERETVYIANGSTYHSRNSDELVSFLNMMNEKGFILKDKAHQTTREYFSSKEVLNNFFTSAFDQLVTPKNQQTFNHQHHVKS